MLNNELYHYGTPRHSGRYPWGSGDNPYQHMQDFLSEYRKYKGQGLGDVEISEKMHCTVKELRDRNSAASEAERMAKIAYCVKLKDKGYSKTEIARRMEVNESVVRSWLKKAEEKQEQTIQETVQMLKRELSDKTYLDVGKGVELDLGIPRKKLDAALQYLKDEGYLCENIKVRQATMANQTTGVLTLAKPGQTIDNIYKNIDKIESITSYSGNGGEAWQKTEYPSFIDSKRIKVKYNEEGGVDKDGVIEIRRGLKDLNLGNSLYSQVRIGVDGDYYIKGMCVYNDNLPAGIDILVNSNKHLGTPLKGTGDNSVLKKLKSDANLPFGATIKAGGQSYYEDKKGDYVLDNGIYRKAEPTDSKDAQRYSLNYVNKINDQGDWATWSKNLAAQFLSKQNIGLIKKQLNLSYAAKADEYDEISKLTNPEIKKKLLLAFSNNCDASAVDLKAAALPRQQQHVIIPIESLKDNEVYAPNYKDGETLCLVRYPHEGTFQIPMVKVNNKNREAIKYLGKNAIDAIGINSRVAEKLSGADFDGDTVMVLPTNSKIKIDSRPMLKDLEGYDAKEVYKGYKGMKVLTDERKQLEMGLVSNLITDMTLFGAEDDEVARAVKYSMCIIDAVKHELDWQRCKQENGIIELKKKWQGTNSKGQAAGAATIISRASSEASALERSYAKIDKDTGELNYVETGRKYKVPVTYKDENGKKVYVTDEDGKQVYKTDADGNYILKDALSKTTKMALADDAYELTSRGDPELNHPKENEYADYANKLKALANEARKELMATPSEKRDPIAAKEYAEEVESLENKLRRAEANAPRERQAQVRATSVVRQIKKDNPDLDKEHLQKHSQQALAQARLEFGANKSDVSVVITPKEWEAIQANAVSPTLLRNILNNTDLDVIKSYATPRSENSITPSQQNLIKAYANSGHTNADIAKALGISASTVSRYLNSEN